MRGIRLLPETVSGAPLRPFTLRFRDPIAERAFQHGLAVAVMAGYQLESSTRGLF